MTPYRFYRLNEFNHFVGVEDIDAHDDAAALLGVERRLRCKASPGFELWQAARRVARRPPEPGPGQRNASPSNAPDFRQASMYLK